MCSSSNSADNSHAAKISSFRFRSDGTDDSESQHSVDGTHDTDLEYPYDENEKELHDSGIPGGGTLTSLYVHRYPRLC